MYTTNANVMYPCPELITDDPLFLLKSGRHYDPLHKVSPSHSLSPKVSTDSESQESAPACVESTLSTSVEVDDTAFCSEEAKPDVHLGSVFEEAPGFSEDCNDELDTVRILASLCANAPDYEIRDCLRKYSPDFSLKRQKSAFNTVTKAILVKSAEYLNIVTEKLNKPDIVNLLICKVQNLLPDICQLCNASYVSKIDDPPLLSCRTRRTRTTTRTIYLSQHTK